MGTTPFAPPEHGDPISNKNHGRTAASLASLAIARLKSRGRADQKAMWSCSLHTFDNETGHGDFRYRPSAAFTKVSIGA